MKGLIFKRGLGLITGIYDRKRNDLRWQEMLYIEEIRSPLFDIPVECKKQLRGRTLTNLSNLPSTCLWTRQKHAPMIALRVYEG